MLLHQRQCIHCSVEAVDLLVRVPNYNLRLVLVQAKVNYFDSRETWFKQMSSMAGFMSCASSMSKTSYW